MVYVLSCGGGVAAAAFCGWWLRGGGALRLGKPVASQGDFGATGACACLVSGQIARRPSRELLRRPVVAAARCEVQISTTYVKAAAERLVC